MTFRECFWIFEVNVFISFFHVGVSFFLLKLIEAFEKPIYYSTRAGEAPLLSSMRQAFNFQSIHLLFFEPISLSSFLHAKFNKFVSIENLI